MAKADALSYDIKSDKVVQPDEDASDRTAPIIDGATFAEHHKASLGKETVPEEELADPTQVNWVVIALMAVAMILIMAAMAWSYFNARKPGIS